MKNLRPHIAYFSILILLGFYARVIRTEAIGTYSMFWELGKDGSFIQSDTTFLPATYTQRNTITLRNGNDSTFLPGVFREVIINYDDSTNYHFLLPVNASEKTNIQQGNLFMYQANDSTLVAINFSELNDSLSIDTVRYAINLLGGDTNKIAYQVNSDSTNFISAPTSSNQILFYNGVNIIWRIKPDTTRKAYSLLGGSTNKIPIQLAADSTIFITATHAAAVSTVMLRDGSGNTQANIIDAITGFRYNSTGTSGEYLRGNGSNIVLSTIQEPDLPSRTSSDISDFNTAVNSLISTYVTNWATAHTLSLEYLDHDTTAQTQDVLVP